MSQHLELPDAVYAALQRAAQESGTTPAGWIAARLPENGVANGAPERIDPQAAPDWLDHDFLDAYAHEADDSVSLDEVRQALSNIPGSITDDIRAERDER
jgi:hypothetical protein